MTSTPPDGPTPPSGPIFVVGASRSGTALMRSCLNGHPDIHLAGETHYFDDLRARLASSGAGMSADDVARECEDYFLALTHRPYGHGGDPAYATISREDLRKRLRHDGEPGDAVAIGDDYFRAYCLLRSDEVDAVRWGEKTPRHVYRLHDILSRYQDARAVMMVRDPRAVVASYRDWKNQGGFDFDADPGHLNALDKEHDRTRRSYHPVLATLLWKGGVRAAESASKAFEGRVLLQRYEDLVLDPETTLHRVCEWLGIEFQDSMMDVPIHNSSFAKFQASGGFSEAAISRWRERLSTPEVRVVQVACGDTLTFAGYEPDSVPKHLVRTTLTFVLLPFAVLRAVLANRERLGSFPSYVKQRLGPLLRRG